MGFVGFLTAVAAAVPAAAAGKEKEKEKEKGECRAEKIGHAAVVWSATIDSGWDSTAGGSIGLGLTLRGGEAELQRDSFTAFLPKVQTLLMHYAYLRGEGPGIGE